MVLEIRNKHSLIKILRTISWLDSKRWHKDENYNFIKFFRDDLTNSEKILTHWICYITDRQMPFEVIWEKGGYIFSELVFEYSRTNLLSKKVIVNFYETYKDKKGIRKFRFKSSDSEYFASRYITDDYQNILQTLEILSYGKYGKNIIKYIVDLIIRFKDQDDILIRVACGLHLLTYQLERKKAIPKRILRIINSDKKFNEKLEEFKKLSMKGKKRLWCCVRDYKKGLYHDIFNKAIEEVYGENAEEIINIWNSLPMEQIELPGDVWNNSPLFRDNLFGNIVNITEIPDSWGMPKIIREIYNQMKDKEDLSFFYPEQFDITFDFVPRMCNKELCNVCPFGPNGAEFICIPSQDKYCPVSLICCGYITTCVGFRKECIIKDGISKGICEGV